MTDTPHDGEQLGTLSHEIDANFNSLLVRVRVTHAGEAAWDRYYSSARKIYGDLPVWRLQRDENGYTTMELMKLIGIFGSDIANPAIPSPVEMNFKIVDEA